MAVSICGVDVHDCNLICRFNDNGGSIADFSGLLSYCRQSLSPPLTDANCVAYFMTNCQLYVSSSSGSNNNFSSSSVVCPSHEFDWDSVSSGFVDAFPVFATIFGVWCIVKLFRMIWWGAK